MFDQISNPFFTLLFVKLAEENEFGIVIFRNGFYISVTLLKISPVKNTKAFKWSVKV